MKVLSDRPIVYFDVDNTLVFSVAEFPEYGDKDHNVLKPITIGEVRCRRWYLHMKHVEMIKDFHARGHTVVVWSAGGSNWAEKVIMAANLQDYVDLVMPKPTWYFDDQPAVNWMPNNIKYFKRVK